MTPEDTLRQHSFVILGRMKSGTEDVVNLDVALAAVAAEREACAAVAEDTAAGVDAESIAAAIRAR